MGDDVERHGEILRAVRGPAEDAVVVHAQWVADEDVVILQTDALATLDSLHTTRGVVWLMTEIATQNYALDVGKLQLNPSSGDVSLSIELETDAGLDRRTFDHAVLRLEALAPKLRARLATPPDDAD